MKKTLSFEKKHMSITSSTNVVFELMNYSQFQKYLKENSLFRQIWH